MHPIITQALLVEKGYVAGEYRMPHGPMKSCFARFPWLLKYYEPKYLAQVCPQPIRTEFVDFSPMEGEKARLIDEQGDLVCFSLNDLLFLWKFGTAWLSNIKVEGEFEPGEPLRSALGRFWLSRQKVKYVLSYSPRTQAAIIYYVPSPPANPGSKSVIAGSEYTITRWFVERTKVTTEERILQIRMSLRSLLRTYGVGRKEDASAPA